MNDDPDYERRQSVADKADSAHLLARVLSAQLVAHSQEDLRIFTKLDSTIADIAKDVKDISKWIWIATGAMLALNKILDFLIPHH